MLTIDEIKELGNLHNFIIVEYSSFITLVAKSNPKDDFWNTHKLLPTEVITFYLNNNREITKIEYSRDLLGDSETGYYFPAAQNPIFGNDFSYDDLDNLLKHCVKQIKVAHLKYKMNKLNGDFQ